MAGLPAVGTLSYNGITFSGASTVNVHVEFVKDEANRTVIYHKHKITVRAIVTATPTDTDLLSIRAALSKQGEELRFINRGFGTDLIVNRAGGGGLRDVKWGPVPEELSWESIGSANAGEIVWQVTTCIPVCDTAGQHRTTGIMAVNYDCSFDISEKGFTTRRITGYLEIAQTRRGRNVPDSADAYRSFINPAAPDGFKRTQSYSTSADKSRLDFVISDTEIETKNPWPAGVVNITAKHRSGWGLRRGATTLHNTITADIELVRGRKWSEAWLIFGAIVAKRVNASTAVGRPIFLESIDAEEDIFGYASSFSVSYRTIELDPVGAQLPDMLTTGLWTKVGTNWNLWKASVKQAMENRGHAGLHLYADHDAIVDICGGQATLLGDNQSQTQEQPATTAKWFRNQIPPPDKCYLQYEMGLGMVSDRGNVIQRTMQTPDDPVGSATMREGSVQRFGNAGGVNDTIQRSGRASYEIMLVGNATRIGRPVPKPLLTTIGGQPATEMHANYFQRALGAVLGAPVFAAAWSIRYSVPNAPGIEVPANIQQGVPTTK